VQHNFVLKLVFRRNTNSRLYFVKKVARSKSKKATHGSTNIGEKKKRKEPKQEKTTRKGLILTWKIKSILGLN
jgi:hypothetical protein